MRIPSPPTSGASRRPRSRPALANRRAAPMGTPALSFAACGWNRAVAPRMASPFSGLCSAAGALAARSPADGRLQPSATACGAARTRPCQAGLCAPVARCGPSQTGRCWAAATSTRRSRRRLPSAGGRARDSALPTSCAAAALEAPAATATGTSPGRATASPPPIRRCNFRRAPSPRLLLSTWRRWLGRTRCCSASSACSPIAESAGAPRPPRQSAPPTTSITTQASC
mmetsp:Transcript_16138/g.51756  ORF Transcript_16138/g.51756 Transcript_16138/m.51756 type:complete len:228 (+) Transcript_16138:318-1001(+)